MDIDLTGFTAFQQQALFELLILAMYADGHLTTIEDEQLQKLLIAMGHTEESDRQRAFDAAVTRMRPCVQSLQKAREQAVQLAGAFTDRPPTAAGLCGGAADHDKRPPCEHLGDDLVVRAPPEIQGVTA